MNRTSEATFETVLEDNLLQHGYLPIARDGFDRTRAIFPATVLAFLQETQPREWARLEALHGERTGEQVLGDLCKWMDEHGALSTLRAGVPRSPTPPGSPGPPRGRGRRRDGPRSMGAL